ncbi:2,3-bisphosphoglycerate-independent phosphoglycerate mutase-domain-containing protein [Sporodiniella umbellata]|nr:2,3-bisphosphoglycerate-independent phosphoglycerate mutase-domain-containing protein [Sporodiniella umbellata]
MKKLLIFLIDGIGDVAVPELDFKTPLQVANVPWMDKLAECGWNGLLDPVEPGLACGSDVAHLSILGYNPRKYYRGRGAFESMGAGLDMKPGDIAFKSNFAYLEKETGVVKLRKADSHFGSLGPVFCESVDNIKLPSFPQHEITVQYAIDHRCGIRIRGPNITDTITGTDPLKDDKQLIYCKPTADNEESRMTSKIVNELSDAFIDILSKHPLNKDRIEQGKNPANCILLRGCSSCIEVPTFEEVHGLKPFLIAPTCIIAGIGMTLGMDLVKVPGATGDYSTDFNAKARACVENISSNVYDFGFCHLKAVDDAGHDRDIYKKIHYLEKIDEMIGSVLQELEQKSSESYTVIITGDHTTPALYGDHSCEPVPFSLCCIPFEKGDNVRSFDENSVSSGSLGRFCGDQVMPIAKHFMNK